MVTEAAIVFISHKFKLAQNTFPSTNYVPGRKSNGVCACVLTDVLFVLELDKRQRNKNTWKKMAKWFEILHTTTQHLALKRWSIGTKIWQKKKNTIESNLSCHGIVNDKNKSIKRITICEWCTNCILSLSTRERMPPCVRFALFRPQLDEIQIKARFT